MQAALRLMRVTSELRGAVATARWLSSGAVRLWLYFSRPPDSPIDRGYVVVSNDGRRSRDRYVRPELPPGVPMQEVHEPVTLARAVGQDL